MNNPDVERYLAGTLDEERSRLLEQHLRTCARCSAEVAEFAEFQRIVDTVLNEPPPDGDLVLQRALRQIRAEAAAKRRRRAAVLGSAAAVVLAAALTTGVMVGRSGDSLGPVRASATDPGTGAALAVSFADTSGWSHLSAAVSGVPMGAQCELVLVGRDGRETVAAGWRVTADKSTVDVSTLMDPADIASVRLENPAGSRLVTVNL